MQTKLDKFLMIRLNHGIDQCDFCNFCSIIYTHHGKVVILCDKVNLYENNFCIVFLEIK